MASSLKSQVSAFFVPQSPFPLPSQCHNPPVALSRFLTESPGWFASNLSPFQSHLRCCQTCFPRTAFIIPTSFLQNQFAYHMQSKFELPPSPWAAIPVSLSHPVSLCSIPNFFCQARIFPSYSILLCVLPSPPEMPSPLRFKSETSSGFSSTPFIGRPSRPHPGSAPSGAPDCSLPPLPRSLHGRHYISPKPSVRQCLLCHHSSWSHCLQWLELTQMSLQTSFTQFFTLLVQTLGPDLCGAFRPHL